jgi:hypothetical protein
MSWLSSFLHPDRGYKAAQAELEKYYNQAQGYQKPYYDQGQDAYGDYRSILKNLINPTALQDEWSKSYKESDMARAAEADAEQGGLQAASSMGLLGSQPALNAIQFGKARIGMQDKQSYLDSLMQKYLAGAGIAQDIYGKGANAASNLSNNASNMGTNSANTAFGKTNAGGDLLSKIIEGAISFATPVGQAWGMNKLGVGGNSPWSTNNSAPWSTTGGR